MKGSMPNSPSSSSAPKSAAAVKLPEGFSVYLDLVRVLAALAVWFHHIGDFHSWWPVQNFLKPGLDAIIVFFVLSGYVIAFASDTREKTLQEYTLRRMARI